MRYGSFLLAVLVLILGWMLAIWSSDNFTYCINHSGQYPTAQNDEHKTPAIAPTNPGLIELYWVCVADFTNDNGAAITGLATVLLTLVTAGLVILGYEQSSNAQAQLRAYVAVENIGISDGSNLTPQRVDRLGWAGTSLSIKNGGQTPASEVIHWTNLDVSTVNNPALNMPPDIAGPTTIIPASGVTTKALWMARSLALSELPEIKAGRSAIYVYGWITYKDVFGKRRDTKYRLMYSGDWPPIAGAVLTFCEGGNSFT